MGRNSVQAFAAVKRADLKVTAVSWTLRDKLLFTQP
jgi:hypothetical protein